MASWLEVWRPEGAQLVALDGDRVTVGSHPESDVALADGRASRLHAVLERFPTGWVIRDLGSRNGTFVNGRRLEGDHVLRPGDEIRVGSTRLVMRTEARESPHTVTDAAQAPPPLTARERDVLVELCRPLLAGDVFTEPASIRQVAGALGVTDAAVKQHLLHLYDKFGVYDEPTRRRVGLANEALRRGAVAISDLRPRP